jgi:hypothetical protein
MRRLMTGNNAMPTPTASPALDTPAPWSTRRLVPRTRLGYWPAILIVHYGEKKTKPNIHTFSSSNSRIGSRSSSFDAKFGHASHVAFIA